MRIDVTHSVEGVDYELKALFPDLYPYFRPVVSTQQRFRFHQDPFSGTLCLLARDPTLWSPDDSLAGLITSQLPMIIQANGDDGPAAAAVEEAVPEPLAEAYTYDARSVVFVDSSWQIPADAVSGTMTLMLSHLGWPLRAAVLSLSADRPLASADRRLRGAFKRGQLEARWVRISEAVVADSPEEILASAVDASPDIARPQWQRLGDAEVDVVGVVFPDEVRYAEDGDNWLFLLRVRGRAEQAKPGGRATGGRLPTALHLVRAMRAGPADLKVRAPALSWLSSRRVAVFGLGALGGPATIALAKAGVGSLSLLDPDFVEAGTTPRWAYGLSAAGFPKVEALKASIAAEYPYTEVVRWVVTRLGSPAEFGCSDVAALEAALDGANLIFDATANIRANHALADIAWELGLPYVRVVATAGAWGGSILRLQRGQTACWSCYVTALGVSIPHAPADPDGAVAPVACSDTTFVGAAFDLTPLADEAVRITVATLATAADPYPPISWDVATLSLRDDEGRLVPPTWEVHQLPPTTDCPRCGS